MSTFTFPIKHLRPDAKHKDLSVDIDGDIEAQARKFTEAGGRFKIKDLSADHVSVVPVDPPVDTHTTEKDQRMIIIKK